MQLFDKETGHRKMNNSDHTFNNDSNKERCWMD